MGRNLIYNHFVFVTKMRQAVIDPARERDLFAYIMGVTNNLGGTLIRINAALNHVHVLVKLPTTVCAADYMATVKRASSIYVKKTGLFPGFEGWAKEYSVNTVSPELVPRITAYIANQKEHHKIKTFEDEWLELLSVEECKSWDMRFFDK